MSKPNMAECRSCVEMAWAFHREFMRVRREAHAFTPCEARDRMFFLAGKKQGRAIGYLREARSHHTETLSASIRRLIKRVA